MLACNSAVLVQLGKVGRGGVGWTSGILVKLMHMVAHDSEMDGHLYWRSRRIVLLSKMSDAKHWQKYRWHGPPHNHY